MKSFIRWSAMLTLVGSVLFGSLFGAGTRAFALPDDQVMERLDTVPVFTLVDGSGSLVVATFSEQEDAPPVATVFISHQGAENFLRNMQTSNPEIAEGVRIAPISLGRVYEIALAGQEEENPLQVAFIPVRQEVDAALAILEEDGQTVEEFPGVPLFVAKSGEGENEAILTIRRGEEEVIPMYFSEADIQAAIAELRQSQPDLADTVRVEVVPLGRLIENLRTSDNPELNQIYLVPPRESLEFIRSLQERAAEQQQQQTPAP
ncbi:Tic22 family protein [Egbenema bharatensis]|uniref:Tic22 family protein n=1 Tax=Egbenema bharatensis TaxID=3463334 RepID=UPI003A8C3742